MKGIIKRRGLRCLSFAAACLIAVSDAGYPGIALNISAVSQTGVYKTWKQYDKRWGDLHLGKSGYNMRGSGCAATAMAFLLVHAGNFSEDNFDPGIFCRLMTENGGFGSGGEIIWDKVRTVAPGFRFSGTHYLDNNISYEERVKTIKKYYDEGYFLVIDVQNSGHWVAVDTIKNGRVISFDAGGDRNTDVFEQYNHQGNTCIKLFKSEYTTEAPPEPEYTFNTGYYVTTTQLNIRKSPTSSSELLGRLEKGTKVDVRGISGCWGKVILNSAPAWICLEYTEPYTGNNAAAPEIKPAVTSAPPAVTAAPVTTTVTTAATTITTTTTSVTTVTSETTAAVTTPVTTAVTSVSETASPVIYKPGIYKTNDWLNYRNGPDITSELFGTIPLGTELDVSEISGKWGRTEFNGRKCWVCLEYADFIKMNEVQPEVTAPVTVTEPEESVTTATSPVTANVVTMPPETEVDLPETSDASGQYLFRGKTISALNFRKGPGTDREIICVIPVNTSLTVIETAADDDRWGRILYNNQEGWVCLDYVAGPEPDRFGIVRGDVDRNGYVNVLDYIMLKSIFEGRTDIRATAEADVNADGSVTVHDLVELRSIFISET